MSADGEEEAPGPPQCSTIYVTIWRAGSSEFQCSREGTNALTYPPGVYVARTRDFALASLTIFLYIYIFFCQFLLSFILILLLCTQYTVGFFWGVGRFGGGVKTKHQSRRKGNL